MCFFLISLELELLHPGLWVEQILLNPHPFSWLAILCVYIGFPPFPDWQNVLQEVKTHMKRKIIAVLYLSNLLKKNRLNSRQKKEEKQTVQDSWVLECRASALFNSVCFLHLLLSIS